MKTKTITSLSAFVIALFALFSFATGKNEVQLKVIFQNPNNTEFKGKFEIVETGQVFEISEAKEFIIPIAKGKYHFNFTSETSHFLSFPEKITKSQNKVTVIINPSRNAITGDDYANEKNWEEMMKSGKLVEFGYTPVANSEFTKKYGVDIKNQGCVIPPQNSKDATANNQLIAKYLDEKFGEGWKKN